MDCGPAALKCLLEGFGIDVSYDRLREACQTGIDGTSIDTMEAVANQLGLEAEQVMLPVDHVALRSAQALPAIVVVQLPTGLTHFVVVWKRHGNIVQVMDPAMGRRWTKEREFLREVFSHETTVPAEGWLEFAHSSEFQSGLTERHKKIGISRQRSVALIAKAKGTGTWQSVGALDAATRLVTSLVAARGARLKDSMKVVERFCANSALIPARFWSVREALADEEGIEHLIVRGAVLVRIRGKRAVCASEIESAELAAALQSKPIHPALELLRYAKQGGGLTIWLLLLALAAASCGVILEALLFRGLFDVVGGLGLAGQRIGAAVAVLLFSLLLLLLEVPLFGSALRFGRQMENRLRLAFLKKIPQLSDRYFQSRLTSDMAERSHATHRLRNVAVLVNLLCRNCFELVLTGAAILWIAPASAPFVILTVAFGLIPGFAAQPVLAERDLRARSHSAGLTRFYLDAMLGLASIRAHCAERSIRREHNQLLGAWASACLRLQKTSVTLEAVQLFGMFGLIATLLLTTPMQGAAAGRVLLLVYWALNLPAIGQEIGALARQYPSYRNLTLRLLEPLGAVEQESAALKADAQVTTSGPVAIALRDVTVEVAGHKILEDVSLQIEPGSHIAIVGPSGAGKSSLVGTLLGWLQPKSGSILVDDQLLDCEKLRPQMAWVDPSVQLWNRTLFANLTYGSKNHPQSVGQVIDAALLRNVLENLPEGMQTKLGEGGALVSGGEGQRVRFGRALLRPDVRLVILDEPFRGLDREKRRELLRGAREYWRHSTLLCVTHDLRETLDFDRVVVVENGSITEDGLPYELARSRGRYSELLAAEEEVRSGLWSQRIWRRIRLHAGRVVEDSAEMVSIEDETLVSS